MTKPGNRTGDFRLSAKRQNAIGLGYFFFTAACWSIVAVVVKELSDSVDPYTLSFYRVFFATFLLAVIFVGQKGDWRRLQWFVPLILIGALGRVSNYFLQSVGIAETTASAAVLLAPAQQIGVVLLAWWLLHERMRTKWLGLVLSFLGLILIFWNGQPLAQLFAVSYSWGYVLLIFSGFATSIQFTTQKMLSKEFTAAEIMLPVFVLSSVMTFPVAAASGGFSRSYDLWTWILLLFIGLVLTGGAFYSLGEGFKRCDSTTGVVIINCGVFFTLFWSYMLLGERIGIIMIAGCALGFLGTIAVIRAERKQLHQAETHAEQPAAPSASHP